MQNKRFIAAAVCPACSKQDTIYTYSHSEDDRKWRACASCDFEESLDQTAASTEELPTRVNQARLGEPALSHETAVEAVKLIEPKNTLH
jgi:hypothetical protein